MTPTPDKVIKTETSKNSEQLASANQHRRTKAGVEDFKGGKLTYEQRSEILSQVFFEGEKEFPTSNNSTCSSRYPPLSRPLA